MVIFSLRPLRGRKASFMVAVFNLSFIPFFKKLFYLILFPWVLETKISIYKLKTFVTKAAYPSRTINR